MGCPCSTSVEPEDPVIAARDNSGYFGDNDDNEDVDEDDDKDDGSNHVRFAPIRNKKRERS